MQLLWRVFLTTPGVDLLPVLDTTLEAEDMLPVRLRMEQEAEQVLSTRRRLVVRPFGNSQSGRV